MIDKIWEILGICVVASIAALALWCVGAALLTNGQVDYCYLNASSRGRTPQTWMLWQHRSWRHDNLTAEFETYDAAIQGAAKIACPLH